MEHPIKLLFSLTILALTIESLLLDSLSNGLQFIYLLPELLVL